MPRSVNQLLDELNSVEDAPIEVEGVLNAQPEGYELLHYPKSERRGNDEVEEPIYRSNVWLAFGNGSLQPNHSALARWLGKRVRVHGIVQTASSPLPSREFHHHGGFGPYGFWLAQLEVYSIQRVTAEARRESGA
jgi:hypothetical protein